MRMNSGNILKDGGGFQMSEMNYYNNLLMVLQNLRDCGLSDEYVYEELTN